MVKAASKPKAGVKARTATVAYDVAEKLRTPEEMAAYLDAWLEEAPEDAAGIARALGDIARAKGMTQVARDDAIQETLYLLSIPGMRESIKKGMAEPLEKSAREVKW